MTKHKLGLVGVLHVHPDGTIGLVEPGRFSFAFRVPLDAVVGFTEARGSFTRATLSVLGQGGVIAECSTNYGAADRLNRWLDEHRPASPPASASASPDRSGPGLVADLERLAALHRSGALTADEYAEAKTRLLG